MLKARVARDGPSPVLVQFLVFVTLVDSPYFPLNTPCFGGLLWLIGFQMEEYDAVFSFQLPPAPKLPQSAKVDPKTLAAPVCRSITGGETWQWKVSQIGFEGQSAWEFEGGSSSNLNRESMGKAVEPRRHRSGIGFKPSTGLQEPSCEPMALKGLSSRLPWQWEIGQKQHFLEGVHPKYGEP